MPLNINITVPDDVVLGGMSDQYIRNAMAGFFASMAGAMPDRVYGALLAREEARTGSGEAAGAAPSETTSAALFAADTAGAAEKSVAGAAEAAKAARKPRTPKKAAEAAADAADETIDAAVNKTPVTGTRAELNAAVQAYVAKFGLEKLSVLQAGLALYPIESDADTAGIGAAVAAVQAATASATGAVPAPQAAAAPAVASSSLFGDEPAAPAKPALTATEAECKQAFIDYMQAHGQAAGEAEIPAILTATFGPEVTRFTQLPKTPEAWGTAKAAIDTARLTRKA